jgi:hypothetical protein
LRLVVPATALGILESCPRRHLLEQVMGITPSWPEGNGGAVTPGRVPPRLRGSIVHGALEGIATGPDPVSRVRAVAVTAGVAGEGEIADLEAEVRGAVDRLRAWKTGAALLAAPTGRVLAEVPFDLTRGRARVTGALDLLHLPETGGAVVLDFKTDSDVPRSVGRARELAREKGYVAQLEAYAAAAWLRFGGPVSAWLFFTASGLPVAVAGEDGAPTAEACLEEVHRRLGSAEAAAADGFPLTKDASVCRGCPHQRAGTCPGAR